MSVNNKYIDDVDQLEKQKSQRDVTFNGMTANEWAKNSRSVWKDLPSPKKASFHDNGEIIPEEVCNKIITMYTKEEDIVLDPFMGSGSVIISSIKNNRFCYGIEINADYFKEAKENILDSMNLLVNGNYKLYLGNALEKIELILDQSLNLVLTSPSYPNELDNDINDFSKMNSEIYKENIAKIMSKLYEKIVPGGYNVWVVKDYRDIKNGQPYVAMHNIIAEEAVKAGFLFQDLIIYDHNDQRGLVLLGYPSVFYANLNHSFIVVLRKSK